MWTTGRAATLNDILRISLSPDYDWPAPLGLRGPTVNPRKKATKDRTKIKSARKQNRRQNKS